MVAKSLGSYEILEPLGRGGMGEVYRARDPKLKRDVAIKVLPAEVASDPERRARLEREAELLAQLDHPNVATIHGMEETDGVSFLVMQLVEGRTLEEIIAEGPVPLEEALGLALQVAKGLEAAHGRGIVHRDLKPANIMVADAAGGKRVVKILDFGLAKAYAPDGTLAEASTDAAGPAGTGSPTNLAATQAGTVLGTAAYMSPEQARGKQVDHQADIWALGCVLYEMLTGRQAFTGESASDMVAAVLKEDPDWSDLPSATPAGVRILLTRCLRKDPDQRLQHVGDARLELEEALAERPRERASDRDPAAPHEGIPARLTLAWALAAVAIAVAVGAVWMEVGQPDGGQRSVVRATIPTEQELSGGGSFGGRVAISRDGRRIAYAGRSEGETRLHARALDEDTATTLQGTEGGLAPFFSPDGSWIGFFTDNRLKKVSLETGVVETLTAALAMLGGHWTEDGWIYYTPQPNQGIWRIRADGTMPEKVTEPDVEAGEAGHYYPWVLPGGRAMLFTLELAGRSMDQARIELLSLDTGERRTVVAGGSNARYLPTGHLVYARPGTLVAMPFDSDSLEPTGQPAPIADDISNDPVVAATSYAVSETGTLVYLAGATGGGGGGGVIVWADREGRTTPVALPDGTSWVQPRLSPDGERMVLESRGADDHLWIHEFGQERPRRLTFELENLAPLWTRDGDRITFTRHSTGPPNLHWLTADGGEPTAIHSGEFPQIPTSWSPDGQRLLYHELHPDTGADIRILSLEGDPVSREFLITRSNEDQAVFSPEGRWIAYRSDATGRGEVYVRPSDPRSSRQWQVSTDGGSEPVWAPGGGELYYRNGDQLLAVPYATDGSFRAAAAEPLFSAPLQPGDFGANYDVSPDGSRFLMVNAPETTAPSREIQLVLDWFEELARSVPPGR